MWGCELSIFIKLTFLDNAGDGCLNSFCVVLLNHGDDVAVLVCVHKCVAHPLYICHRAKLI